MNKQTSYIKARKCSSTLASKVISKLMLQLESNKENPLEERNICKEQRETIHKTAMLFVNCKVRWKRKMELNDF